MRSAKSRHSRIISKSPSGFKTFNFKSDFSGYGRVSIKESKHFLYISSGSLYETITLLNLFKIQGIIYAQLLKNMEEKAIETVKTINSIITQQRKYL